MKCSTYDCSNEATQRIKFTLFTKNGNAPATAEPELNCCDKCATDEAAKAILVNNLPGRLAIERHFEQNGFVKPDWTRSFAEWVVI